MPFRWGVGGGGIIVLTVGDPLLSSVILLNSHCLFHNVQLDMAECEVTECGIQTLMITNLALRVVNSVSLLERVCVCWGGGVHHREKRYVISQHLNIWRCLLCKLVTLWKQGLCLIHCCIFHVLHHVLYESGVVPCCFGVAAL